MKIVAEAGKVYTFKLNSGDEHIAKIQTRGGEFLIIEHPVSVAPGPQGLGLVPSMFTADPDAEIKLNSNSVSIYALTDDAVKMKYIEATTGIKVPEKKLILG